MIDFNILSNLELYYPLMKCKKEVDLWDNVGSQHMPKQAIF